MLRKLLYYWKPISVFFFGDRCRFEPSCSEYMVQAVERHGLIHGVWLGVKRLSRCHPYCKGGCDPVSAEHVRFTN